MGCALALVTAVAPLAVPTPAEVILSRSSTAAWTRSLLAQQSDRDVEIEALERDMERSRTRTRRLEEQPTSPPVRDGHRKGYYLAWSIVDWALAGQLWASSLGCWLYSALFSLTASTSDAVGAGEDEPLARLSGALAGAALVLAAGGGLAAWRGGVNVSTYRELRAEEAAMRTPRR